MPDNTLPLDECRCLDSGCSEHPQCLRWLDRKAPGTNSMSSLFPYTIPLGSPCPLRIPPKEADNDNA